MRVYIVRHGKAMELPAVAPGSSARGAADGHPDSGAGCGSGCGCTGRRIPTTDFERELTSRGEAQAAFLAERVSGVAPHPEVILTSRYPRARRTALAVESALRCPMIEDRGLEVDHDVSEALALIERERDAGRKTIMLVGHNPQLGELIGILASGLPPQEMILKTGELVALEIRPSQMIGSAKIVGRLRLGPDRSDETIVGGVFAMSGGKMQLSMR